MVDSQQQRAPASSITAPSAAWGRAGRASRRPTICSDSAASTIATPGNSTSQIAWCAILLAARDHRAPGRQISGGTPTPRNDRPASASTA